MRSLLRSAAMARSLAINSSRGVAVFWIDNDPSAASVTVSGSSWSVGRALAAVLGNSTGTPTVNIGAATMKMINNTNITSTNGVTLISAMGCDRRLRPRPLSDLTTPAPISAVQLTAKDCGKFVRECFVSGKQSITVAAKFIIKNNGRNSCDQAQSCGQQCLGNARGHDGKVCVLLCRNFNKGVHDAPNGPEQPDKGGCGPDGGQDCQTLLQFISCTGHSHIHGSFDP